MFKDAITDGAPPPLGGFNEPNDPIQYVLDTEISRPALAGLRPEPQAALSSVIPLERHTARKPLPSLT